MLEEGNPWPDSLFGPLLFVDPATHFAVASEPDSAGILRPSGPVYVGELPHDVGIANTVIEWNGKRWTMLIWPPPSGNFARGVLLAHELFHRLSPRLGLEMASPTNEHLETAEGRIWLRLEFLALARALTEEGERRREAVLDALRFRARRQAAFPSAADEERALELNEGLAEYTGVRAAVGPVGRAGWAAQLIESREVHAASAGVSRSFAYATGPGYGLLLDAEMPGWQGTVDSKFDLASATSRAYSAGSEADLAAAAPDHTDEYDGDDLALFEFERAATMERRLAIWRVRFFDGPVLRLPADSAFGFIYNPNAIATMKGVGQVLMDGSVHGGWGTLEVEGGGRAHSPGRRKSRRDGRAGTHQSRDTSARWRRMAPRARRRMAARARRAAR